MFRPRVTTRTLFALTILTTAILAGACAAPPEEAIVQRFSRASQMRDNTTLVNFAIVEFDPRTQGTVSSFEIASVSEERVEPLRIGEFTKALADAQEAEQAFTDRKKVYQDANWPAINRVLKAENTKAPVTGKDLAVQAEWNKWREETASHAKEISVARARLSGAHAVPDVSLGNLPPEQVPNLAKAEGQIASKDVTINAQVRLPDGKTEAKTLVVTLQQARLKSASPEGLVGRWIIGAITDAGAAKP